MPRSVLVVCELTAPIEVLKDRVTAREPDEFWWSRLRDFVDLHHDRTDLDLIRSFVVSTHAKSIDVTVAEVLDQAGWIRAT